MIQETLDGYNCKDFGIDLTGKSQEAIFGVPRAVVSFFKKVDIGYRGCEIVKACIERSSAFSEKDIRDLYASEMVDESIISIRKILLYMPLSRIINYYIRQKKSHHYSFLHNLADYLEHAQELGYDLTNKSNLMPKRLNSAHRATTQLLQAKKNPVDAAKLIQMRETTDAAFGFASDGLFVRAPRDIEDLVAEGGELAHCIGTYMRKIVSGQSRILFLRTEACPDQPFFTIDISEDFSITHIQGKSSVGPPAEVEKFIRKWQQHLKKMKKSAA